MASFWKRSLIFARLRGTSRKHKCFFHLLSVLRQNLKNLSRGLNLSCGSKMIGSLKIVLNFSRFKYFEICTFDEF